METPADFYRAAGEKEQECTEITECKRLKEDVIKYNKLISSLLKENEMLKVEVATYREFFKHNS